MDAIAYEVRTADGTCLHRCENLIGAIEYCENNDAAPDWCVTELDAGGVTNQTAWRKVCSDSHDKQYDAIKDAAREYVGGLRLALKTDPLLTLPTAAGVMLGLIDLALDLERLQPRTGFLQTMPEKFRELVESAIEQELEKTS